MEWASESAAVRRHRVGGERRDGPAAAPQPGSEAPAQEPPEDACGGGGGARTRKRSAGGGGASRGAGTGLSEARAALGLALYLLALRALVQLSLQQLVLRGPAGRHGEFDARQARYPPLPPGPRVRLRPGPGAAAPAGARPPPPPGIARARRRPRPHVGRGGPARPCPGVPVYGWRSLPCPPAKPGAQLGWGGVPGAGRGSGLRWLGRLRSAPLALGGLVVVPRLLERLPLFTSLPALEMKWEAASVCLGRFVNPLWGVTQYSTS